MLYVGPSLPLKKLVKKLRYYAWKCNYHVWIIKIEAIVSKLSRHKETDYLQIRRVQT